MIRLSIVTITYNAAATLQRTLDSVRSQDYQHIEHLIVDGASKDGTLALAERYRLDSPYDVIVSSEPDHGLYDAMNKGLQRATGDYIVFLNAGDTLHAPDTLLTVVRAAAPIARPGEAVASAQTLPAVLYGDTAITDEEGHYLHMRTHRPPEHLSWRSFRHGMLVCHQAFYARLDLARAIPYNLSYRHSADVDWCIRLMKEAARLGLPLVNTHAVLADFAEGGNTTKNHHASLKERYRVMAHHYGQVQTFLLHGWFVLRALWYKVRSLV